MGGGRPPSELKKKLPERLTYEEKGRGMATSILTILTEGTAGMATSILLILVQGVGR